MNRPRAPIVAGLLALVVVLAGCGAPVAQPPASSPTPSDGGAQTSQSNDGSANDSAETVPRINLTNGSLTLEPGVVFNRVQSLRGSNVSAPEVIQVYNSIEGFENQSSGVGTGGTREFYMLAGMTAEEVNLTESVTRQKNGYVTGLASIVLYVGTNATEVDELLLVAHELTHYVQIQSGLQRQLVDTLGTTTVTDKRYVVRSLLEGGAVVTTDAYLERYSNTTQTNAEMYTSVQSALPNGHIAKYANGQYVHGHEYMQNRSQSPSDLPDVYENPPRTSEQILHHLDPEAEPPAPLSVSVDTGADWVASGSDRMGEAFVRTALESTVGTDRARRAAAGWGNDSVRFLRPADGDGQTSYAWVLRWDDGANQTEFVSTYRESLNARGNQTEEGWELSESDLSARLTEPTARTAVVVFGPASLTGNVTTSGENGDITVTTG